MEEINMQTASKAAERVRSTAKEEEVSPKSSSCALAEQQKRTPPRQGSLWSGLREISEILRIPVDSAMTESCMRFPLVHCATGQRAFTQGQRFDALYVLRSGFMKSAVIDVYGNEQILSFPMRGDLLGADAIDSGCHQSEAVALSDCVLIQLQFKKLLSLGRTNPEFETNLYGLISRELIREHSMVRMLAGLNAETKVARFLIALSQRYTELGYSGKTFNLRMTRQDIGRYLGLSTESVSRTLNAFADLRLIDIDQRQIVLRDISALSKMHRLKQRREHG